MKAIKIILAIVLLNSISSCRKSETAEAEYSSADSVASYTSEENKEDLVSSSAAVENKKDTSRKFIRTSELKFKVKNVINSTYNIESIALRHGGFVTYTNLMSEINDVTSTAVSADSSLETTFYIVKNSITLRVPNTKLDTTLKDISKNIDFLDYRIIKADDIALQILSNKLTQKRASKTEQRLENAIDNRGKKLNETTNAEEILVRKQEEADNAKISNLSLIDQVNFSTVSLEIYQRETIKRDLISNYKNIDAYEPSFGKKLVDAFKDGWDILEATLVFLTKMWGIIALILVGILLFKFLSNIRNDYLKNLKK